MVWVAALRAIRFKWHATIRGLFKLGLVPTDCVSGVFCVFLDVAFVVLPNQVAQSNSNNDFYSRELMKDT